MIEAADRRISSGCLKLFLLQIYYYFRYLKNSTRASKARSDFRSVASTIKVPSRERARKTLASGASVSFDSGYRAPGLSSHANTNSPIRNDQRIDRTSLTLYLSPTSVSAAQADTNEPRTNRGQDDI